MKCLYDILEVEVTADDAAIRSAYRRLALRYHPDKNQEDPVLAEEKFKEVQNAYEILSNKHERSWYDSHRDAILRSGARHQAGAGPSETRENPEDVVDLYYYFTSACYSGFGDGPKGFYSVFNELFKFLAEQEKQAMDKNGKQSSYPLPPFGLSGAPWSEVAFFYSQWSSFSTVRQFSWADAFNPTAARNRKVRRAVETENAKLRKAAKKEYNESVRSLVGFLKKRDKRVLAHQVEETRLRQEKEAAAQQKRQEEQSERSKRAAKFEVPDWACSDASTQTSDEEVVDDVILWHCPACEKYFKSSAALNNHERSNKHKERVEILRMELEADDLLEHDSAPDPTAYADTDRMSELSMQQDTEINTKTSSEFIKRSSEFDTDKDISVPATFAHAKQEACPVLVNAHLGDEDLVKEDSVKVASKCSTVSSVSSDEDRTEEDMLADLLKMSALGQLMVEDSSPPASQHFSKNSGLNEEDQIEDLSNEPERKIKKKVSGKRGAKNRWHAKKASSAGMDKYRCEACSNEFTSRNQLFKHIKSTGHAMTKAK